MSEFEPRHEMPFSLALEQQKSLNTFNEQVEALSEKLGYLSWHKIVRERSQYMQSQYDDISDYYIYHTMIGSTPDANKVKHFDLEGEDSIVVFVDKKARDLKVDGYEPISNKQHKNLAHSSSG